MVPEVIDFQEIKRICTMAEKHGFDLFTISDHFMNMYYPRGPYNHPLECWTTLAGLSAVTHKIKLGPLVTCYGFRRPTVLAKMATTVDIISGGRLIFGIGAGWHEDEFKGFMGRYPHAGERLTGLNEAVEICKNMFNNEHTTYNGKLFKVDDVLNSPRPVQRPVPILVAGGGEKRTLKIAAKHADISHFFARDLDTLETKLSVLKRHCENIGRNYNDIRKSTGLGVVLGRSESEAEDKLRRRAQILGRPVEIHNTKTLGPLFGTPEKVADTLSEYIKRGLGLITCTFYDFKDIPQFAEEVIPQFS